jgi:uncharacterized protein
MGLAVAQSWYAAALRSTSGGPADDKAAFQWMKAAADQHHFDAQNVLADYHENGFGCAKNADEAFRWAKLSAEQGWAPACATLGRYFENGIGTPVNIQMAVEWKTKAKEFGFE